MKGTFIGVVRGSVPVPSMDGSYRVHIGNKAHVAECFFLQQE